MQYGFETAAADGDSIYFPTGGDGAGGRRRTRKIDTVPLGDSFALIREAEGVTAIRPGRGWARITLTVQSSLAAVGLTARIAAALAERGISANIVAAFHHDHVFVPWDRRGEALAALEALSTRDGRPTGS